MNQSIHIYTDGTTTTAILEDGKNILKKEFSRCSEDDEFEFEYGARLAFERLLRKNPVCGVVHVAVSNSNTRATIVNLSDDKVVETFDDLKEKLEPYYNARLVCVDNNGAPSFTTGKIYEVVDGVLYGDNDEEFDGCALFGDLKFTSLEHINLIMRPHFIEFVE